MTTTENATDWREIFRDRDAWEAATADHDAAEQALMWLTDTIQNVSQQLSDAKAELAGRRLPDDEYGDLMEWRATALNFRRVAESRKRTLTAQIKRQNVARSEASAATQLNHLRTAIWRLAEAGRDVPAADLRALLDAAESPEEGS